MYIIYRLSLRYTSPFYNNKSIFPPFYVFYVIVVCLCIYVFVYLCILNLLFIYFLIFLYLCFQPGNQKAAGETALSPPRNTEIIFRSIQEISKFKK